MSDELAENSLVKTEKVLVLPEMMPVWQETLGWQPSAGFQQQFQLLYELILQGNSQMNLTRITSPEDFWEKHLWDSLRGIAPFLKASAGSASGEPPPDAGAQPASSHAGLKVIDIGTGAGFPGLPVAIVKPEWTVSLLDSTRKKIAFVSSLISDLGIENATAVTGRAEEIGQQPQHRQSYDIALLRAVAPASVCAEYALPLLKTGGQAVLYRGHWTAQETDALGKAVQRLGGAIESLEAFTTPVDRGIRHCVCLRKVAATPAAFPRPTGVPAKQPL
ncbi:16S rRNA (guanine(527)-N(7))-methyltransferase RsmG [Kamptonema formosum]|uniref:16S rRNA (guanine(527)-N(7))-methyltransferase RsmG n=1 Tax=Kamptonema formosum TaxID=331992 RepID=UPI00036798A8|nr:16S rRNA (guanine(527)-N(7))-methyltransferase RsmG [Oscillatoria sp. PCC 10802]